MGDLNTIPNVYGEQSLVSAQRSADSSVKLTNLADNFNIGVIKADQTGIAILPKGTFKTSNAGAAIINGRLATPIAGFTGNPVFPINAGQGFAAFVDAWNKAGAPSLVDNAFISHLPAKLNPPANPRAKLRHVARYF